MRLGRVMQRRGSSLVEAAMLVPVLAGLLIGSYSIARITYTYYMLERVMYNLARYVGTQQGVNFCDPSDPVITGAINYALTGDTTSAENPVVPGLAPAMFHIRAEKYDTAGQQMIECPCSVDGCDPAQGGTGPGYVSVSLTDGFAVTPTFWGFSPGQLTLRPTVRVPYGGT